MEGGSGEREREREREREWREGVERGSGERGRKGVGRRGGEWECESVEVGRGEGGEEVGNRREKTGKHAGSKCREGRFSVKSFLLYSSLPSAGGWVV